MKNPFKGERLIAADQYAVDASRHDYANASPLEVRGRRRDLIATLKEKKLRERRRQLPTN